MDDREKAKLIIERMQVAAKVSSQAKLAGVLGIKPPSVSDAATKGQIPPRWFNVFEEKFGVTKEELCETPEERLIRTYKGNLTKSVKSEWNNETLPASLNPPLEQDHTVTASEMLIMTSVVLESNTVYRSALASNIRAFYQAVKGEQEMSDLRDEIKKMREELSELKALMLAQGAPEKKRAGNDH